MATPFFRRSKKTLQWMNLLNQKETVMYNNRLFFHIANLAYIFGWERLKGNAVAVLGEILVIQLLFILFDV